MVQAEIAEGAADAVDIDVDHLAYAMITEIPTEHLLRKASRADGFATGGKHSDQYRCRTIAAEMERLAQSVLLFEQAQFVEIFGTFLHDFEEMADDDRRALPLPTEGFGVWSRSDSQKGAPS